MTKILNLLVITISILFFSACSAKDIKDVGSSASSGGALGLIVGGTLYGIGSLMESSEDDVKSEEEL